MGSEMSTNARARLVREISLLEHYELPFTTSKAVRKEDHVWIGFEAIIMPETIIGRGAIVGSKSVVFGDVPPYSVVVGNPGKVIRQLPSTDLQKP